MMPSKEAFFQALAARHGEENQAKFDAARVAVCGLGGLGSNIAIMLARAGVGALQLIDFDRVELTNLNRQQFFVDQVGRYKSEALAENLQRIAPYCKLTVQNLKVTAQDIPGLFDGADVICEALDKAETKAMFVSNVLEHYPNTPLVSGVGMAGISSANEIRTRRVTRNLYLCGDGVSDAQAGLPLISGRVTVCAAHQATMILRILAGQQEP